MSKTAKIISQIQSIFDKEISIDVENILETGESYNNMEQIRSAVRIFLSAVKANKISNIEVNEEFKVDATVSEISELFVLGLIEVEPSDFEGDDPLSVNEMIETSSTYVFNQIQKQEITGLNFYI
tara:strand:+ start:82863 stop:83237 length:375 start_codon:yes stop_codon:yes gene_type:complete